MKVRIITGLALACLLAVALYFGGYICSVLIMLCIFLSVYEMYRALDQVSTKCIKWPTWLCIAVSLPLFMEVRSSVSLIVTITAASAMVITSLEMMRQKPSIQNIMLSVLPLVSVVIPGMCMLGIVKNAVVEQDRSLQITLLLLTFGIPLFGDMMAYFIGSKFGRKKLCPSVSPNKSLEGAIAGLAGSIVFSVLAYFVFSSFWDVKPVWHFLLLGFFCGIAGQTGDLFASMIKRYCNIKDFGTIFPGHGGMMDRLDSVYWASIIVYVYLNWIMI